MSSLAIDYSGDAGHAGQTVFASMADIANQTFDGFSASPASTFRR